VSLWGLDDQQTPEPKGQVGRHHHAGHDRAGHGRGRGLWCAGERTRGRTSRLGRHPVAPRRGGRTAAAATDLRGVAGGGPQAGPQPAEVIAALPRQRAGRGAAGDGAQRWPQDGRGGRHGGGLTGAEGRVGRLAPAPDAIVVTPPGQAGVCAQEQRAPSSARDPRDRRQVSTGPDGQRVGARVGGPVRTEVLRVSSRPGLPRRHRGDPHDGQPHRRAASVGARRRPGGGLRPPQP
jgi:hypothetical protein